MKKTFSIFKKTMIGILIFIGIAVLAVLAYLQHPKFGKAPSGKRLERIRQSPQYRAGKFQNTHYTPMVSEGYSLIKVTFDFIFGTFPRTRPVSQIPSVKTDLRSLPVSDNILVWFGHSSYLIQLDGIRFLVDPVFSGNASPFPGSNKSFNGTDIYSADDMPDIDYLLITHDHYDHLHYETVLKLRPRVKHIVCGLGVGEHFEHWKFDPARIIEKDWNERISIGEGFILHTAPARHFSGRGLQGNGTLWLSYILQAPHMKLYLGGDSGYDTHFAEIGKQFDGFDLALLDNGQYNPAWKEIHLLPDEVLQAANDLGTKRLLPIHSSKFKLGYHPWDEPLARVSTLNDEARQTTLITPKIGEIVYLNDGEQTFARWWEDLE